MPTKTIRSRLPALAALLAGLLLHPAGRAADETMLQRLALCQDSWVDWKGDPARMAALAAHVGQPSEPESPDGGFAPRAETALLGAKVTRLYPQSVGSGVGFSVLVEAGAAQARAAVERQWGRPMSCETGDGSQGCELKIGPRRTVVLMTGDNGRARTSLLGCFYLYQQ